MSRTKKESAVGTTDRRSEVACRNSRELTDTQRWLLQIMREYRFGRIENLPVRGGRPVLDEGWRIVRAVRLGRERDRAQALMGGETFGLKQAILDLFEELARVGDGLIVHLEFRHGLPCLLETTVVVDSAARKPNIDLKENESYDQPRMA